MFSYDTTGQAVYEVDSHGNKVMITNPRSPQMGRFEMGFLQNEDMISVTSQEADSSPLKTSIAKKNILITQHFTPSPKKGANIEEDDDDQLKNSLFGDNEDKEMMEVQNKMKT